MLNDFDWSPYDKYSEYNVLQIVRSAVTPAGKIFRRTTRKRSKHCAQSANRYEPLSPRPLALNRRFVTSWAV